MKAGKVVMIALLAALAINWVRQGSSFPIVQTLPFLSGDKPRLAYEVGGLILLGMGWWGFSRLRRLGRDRDERAARAPLSRQQCECAKAPDGHSAAVARPRSSGIDGA